MTQLIAHGILLTLMVGSPVSACSLLPSEVSATMRVTPSAEVLRRLWDSSECERKLLEGVASGSPAWISLAMELRPHTDAAAAETLDGALGEAMLRAPSRVLPLIGSPDGVTETACLPLMMDDSGRSDERYRQVVRRARAMFKSFARTRLAPQALLCMKEIAAYERGPLFRGRR